MPRVALSPAFLRSMKPPASGQVEYSDTVCVGLRLRLSHGGSATWLLGWRDSAGKARRFVLGSFPGTGLSAARDAARALRERVRAGADPVAEQRQARSKPAPATSPATMAAVLDAYARHIGERRTWPATRQRIENVFRPHQARASAGITSAELQLTADEHASRASAGVAVRYLRPIARWAAKRGWMQSGISTALEQPDGANKSPRERVLTREELRAVLNALPAVGNYGLAIRWILLTACRRSEVSGMRWRDIDLHAGTWTIAQTKQDRPHVVPLPQQALDLLVALRGCRAGGDDESLIFTNRNGNALGKWHDATRRLHRLSGTADWQRHDLRRSISTMAADLGGAPHVIEVMLGHRLSKSSDGSTLGRVAETYNRSRYVREHAAALQLVADELDRIEAGVVSNIVPIRERA
jgi:site-specific recombinase XerD